MEQASLIPSDQLEPERELTGCTRCKAPVFFMRTEKRALGIFNWEPDPEGRIWLTSDGIAHYRKEDEPRVVGRTYYTSHFSSCPFASEFRTP